MEQAGSVFRKAVTITGSNCEPEHLLISARLLFFRNCLPVRTVGCHGIESIGDRQKFWRLKVYPGPAIN